MAALEVPPATGLASPVVVAPEVPPDTGLEPAHAAELASVPVAAPEPETPSVAAPEPETPSVAAPEPGRPIPPAGGRILASVDVGSNSVHLLVASVLDHRLTPLADESVFLGLGAAVDIGSFGLETRERLVEALVAYGELAQGIGSEAVTFIGTEPLRRAADAAAVVRALERAGWPLHVVSHEEEALLTLVGATGGRPVTADLAVVDVGGGSSELALVGPDRPALALGIRAGSARLTRRLVRHDPPVRDEIEAVRDAARDLFAAAPEAAVSELVAVGGTASNLVKVLALHDGGELDDWLTTERLERAIEALVARPSAEIAERFVLNPTRARVLPAGAAILEAILHRYGLDRLRASDVGLREGTVLVTAHAGVWWRDALPTLARGWVR